MYVDLCILAEIAQRAYMYGLGDVLKYLTKYIQNLVLKKSHICPYWCVSGPTTAQTGKPRDLALYTQPQCADGQSNISSWSFMPLIMSSWVTSVGE